MLEIYHAAGAGLGWGNSIQLDDQEAETYPERQETS